MVDLGIGLKIERFKQTSLITFHAADQWSKVKVPRLLSMIRRSMTMGGP